MKEPTEEQLIASFYTNAKNGKVGGRELETYLKGVNGIRVLCKIMKYLVQIGITPQLIFSKVADNTDEDDERQAEARRESSDFVRKIISGAFAVRSYDYFRATPPRRDDHVHIDPVELACAVTERCRTFTILVTLNKIGLELPQQLRKVWQGSSKLYNRAQRRWQHVSDLLILQNVKMPDNMFEHLVTINPQKNRLQRAPRRPTPARNGAKDEFFPVYVVEEDH